MPSGYENSEEDYAGPEPGWLFYAATLSVLVLVVVAYWWLR
jgi:hypothetical protein